MSIHWFMTVSKKLIYLHSSSRLTWVISLSASQHSGRGLNKGPTSSQNSFYLPTLEWPDWLVLMAN